MNAADVGWRVVVFVATAVVVLGVTGVAVLLRRRSAGPARKPLPPLSTPPTYPRALHGPVEATFAGTVYADEAGGPVRNPRLGGRGRVRLALAAEGLVLERHGTDDLLIDEQEITGAETEGDVLAVHWTHGEVPLTTRVALPDGEEAGAWARVLDRVGRQQR